MHLDIVAIDVTTNTVNGTMNGIAVFMNKNTVKFYAYSNDQWPVSFLGIPEGELATLPLINLGT